MQNIDYLIIGGGVAGTTAAETIRETDLSSSIVILEDESYPLYSRVKIPYYIKGVRTRDELFLRSLKSYEEKNIDLKLGKEVIDLDINSSLVTTGDGESYSYKKLLLTTGGVPKKLKTYPNEHSMQTITDADNIVSAIKEAKKGRVIGSGFIALEFVNVFLHHGLNTRLYVSSRGFWSSVLEKEVSDCIASIIRTSGVEILEGLPSNIDPNSKSDVSSNETIVGMGIGVDLSKSFLKDLKFDGGLIVDSTLKTEHDNIYAAGDVAKFYSMKLGRYVRYGNWTNAVMSGKYAGMNMLGKGEVYDVLSAYSISSQGVNITFLGFTARDPSVQISVKRLSDTSMIQLFTRNGKLDGCVLINDPLERQVYQKIIESREDFLKEPL